MEEITLNSWNDFISCLREIKSKYSQYTINDEPHVYNIAYRGQADSKWPLLTTLERYTSNKQWFLREYLELVLNCVPQIEAFTDKKWSLPTQSNGDILNDIFDHYCPK